MKRIKTQKLKNNQICLSHKWINNVVNNVVNENEKYKCTIVKENDIDLINFINKNDKMIRIKELCFFKDYMYLKITKKKCNGKENKEYKKDKENIVSFVCLKKQKIFIRDDTYNYGCNGTSNYFKMYNSILIDYMCNINNNFSLINDNVEYFDEIENNYIDTNKAISIYINEFLKVYKNEEFSCFIYNTNDKNTNKMYRTDDVGKVFCKKSFYYRPIYINRLINCNIFNKCSEDDYKLLKKIYNTFSYNVSFINNIKIEFFTDIKNYNDNEIYILSETLSDLLKSYNKKNLQVFEYIDMYNILKDPLYYKFIIRDNDNAIVDFVCIQSSYITNKFNSNIYCKNGNYYCSFYSDSSPIHISYILEVVSEYCYKYDIFDIITLNDFFSGEESNYFKIIKKCTKYYYINNVETSFIIGSRKNGLLNIFN